uniref:Uncharacterized protein n=1 Tax=Amphimedon queenslandica TaxID=400682 RepID=A0A1X7TU32_AMPQE
TQSGGKMADFGRKDRLNNLLFYPAILAVGATLSCPFVSVYSIYLF